MIDTLKLAYPLTKKLYALLTQRAEYMQRISPDGEVIWEKALIVENFMEESHYSGLRISCREGSLFQGLEGLTEDQRLDVFVTRVGRLGGGGVTLVKPLVFFEFSLQKWQSKSAYNNMNTTLEQDGVALLKWIFELSRALTYELNPDKFEIYRIDLAENYTLVNGNPKEYLRSFELTLSRYHKAEDKLNRYPGGWKYKSNYIGFKLYWKFLEFQEVEMKKHKSIYSIDHAQQIEMEFINGLKPLTGDEIKTLMRTIRIEAEFKRDFTRRIEPMADIYNLEEYRKRFEEKKAMFLTVDLLTSGEIILADNEQRVVDLVKLHGKKEAQIRYMSELNKSRSQWYNVQKELAAKGINLNALNNSKLRINEIERQDIDVYRLELQ